LRAELSSLEHSELTAKLTRLDPAGAAAIDIRNPARVRRALERLLSPRVQLQFRMPPFNRSKFAIVRSKEDTDARIATRLSSMFESGWLDEVRHLRSKGVSLSDPGMRAIGYRHIWGVIEGKIALEAARQACISDTRRYAKRQRTWLNTEPSLIRVEPDVAIDHILQNLGLNMRFLQNGKSD
jgi:tRNA dimethylallyltransferase